MYPKYIVESMASPIFIAIKVDCYVHTNSIIYLPIFIDTDRTTDVLHSVNTLHVS